LSIFQFQQLGSGNRQSDNFANKQPGMFQKTASPKNVQTSNTKDHKSQLNKKATQQEKEKLKFDDSSEDEDDEEITDEEDMMDENGSEDEMESEGEGEEDDQVSQSPKEKVYFAFISYKLGCNVLQRNTLAKSSQTEAAIG
jgi:hypothetical protein